MSAGRLMRIQSVSGFEKTETSKLEGAAHHVKNSKEKGQESSLLRPQGSFDDRKAVGGFVADLDYTGKYAGTSEERGL